jgi:hypothetical protein
MKETRPVLRPGEGRRFRAETRETVKQEPVGDPPFPRVACWAIRAGNWRTLKQDERVADVRGFWRLSAAVADSLAFFILAAFRTGQPHGAIRCPGGRIFE